MKKIFVCVLSMFLCACTVTSSSTAVSTVNEKETKVSQNFSDEMKIEKEVDMEEEAGADSVERMGDHEGSPYFPQLDFYNMESTDSLTILPKFKTIQQSTEWSCGVDAVMMVLEYYNKLDGYNEETLAQMRTNGLDYAATTLESVLKIFDEVGGFEVASTYDYTEENMHDEITLDMIQDYLSNGVPVIVAWNDWGGHWQVIIGYDTMGTEDYTGDDVIIVADSYDTTDHNQDGYGVYGAERFYYNWTMYDFFEGTKDNERDLLFAAAKPVKE